MHIVYYIRIRIYQLWHIFNTYFVLNVVFIIQEEKRKIFLLDCMEVKISYLNLQVAEDIQVVLDVALQTLQYGALAFLAFD